jgi:membrane protein DedA with SNARE-associated domain
MEHAIQSVLAFTAAHSGWAAAIVFVTAFGESCIFLNLLFPATSLLIAAGTLISAGSLPYLPVLVAAAAGGILGDGAAFWVGRRFGNAVARLWPFARNPELLARGIRFFARHGGKSVFIGRFFGPVRSAVPLVAGIMRMPPDRFWLANIASAIVWAPLLLFAGDIAGEIGGHLLGRADMLALVLGGALLCGLAGAVWALRKLWRR